MTTLKPSKTLSNQELFAKANSYFPGGVHSPVRSFQGLNREPHFFSKGKGAYLIDANGNSFLDFCLSFGPLVLGHANEVVAADLQQAVSDGWSYGAADTKSLALAEFILENIPFIEKIRFMNSGTEAVMTAIRLARGITKRDKILKFNGCYHGHCDSMLIQSGSGAHYLATASSSGVPQSAAQDTLVAELNDFEGLKECFDLYGNTIAAVIIEPLPLNSGLLQQSQEFLAHLQTLAHQYGALVIFDEVYTGFRFGLGGYSSTLFPAIKPDIITYGKIIGGGLPVGAVASSAAYMDHLAPVGSVYQAGTLSANPLTMVAGLSTLKQLTPEAYIQLESNAFEVVSIFSQWLKTHPFIGSEKINIIRVGSFFWFSPVQNSQPKAMKDLPNKNMMLEVFNPLFHTLFKKGIYLSPNPYEVNFISLAMNKVVLDELRFRLFEN